jgi:hypothetical protein
VYSTTCNIAQSLLIIAYLESRGVRSRPKIHIVSGIKGYMAANTQGLVASEMPSVHDTNRVTRDVVANKKIRLERHVREVMES